MVEVKAHKSPKTQFPCPWCLTAVHNVSHGHVPQVPKANDHIEEEHGFHSFYSHVGFLKGTTVTYPKNMDLFDWQKGIWRIPELLH